MELQSCKFNILAHGVTPHCKNSFRTISLIIAVAAFRPGSLELKVNE